MANETESLKTRIKAARDKYQRKGYAETTELLTNVLHWIEQHENKPEQRDDAVYTG